MVGLIAVPIVHIFFDAPNTALQVNFNLDFSVEMVLKFSTIKSAFNYSNLPNGINYRTASRY